MIRAVFRKKKEEKTQENEEEKKEKKKEEKKEEEEGAEVYYYYDPAIEGRLSSDPFLRDPYEEERVYVAPSTLLGAGEGLFAKRKVKAGEVATFYNGFRLTHSEVDARDWSQNSNTLSLDEEIVLDVPFSHIDTKKIYAATLAHKANCQI